jgi:HTH-type transcriptional repressor of NAD biosynthesis genes
MVKAFVFGKFLPFHKGHEAMINFALTQCDWLTVMVCASDNENISGPIRQSWIEKTFQHEKKIEVRLFEYSEKELPNSSESSESISVVWANLFNIRFPGYSRVVTSEPYGAMVANCMGIQHIPFDIAKKQFPVSATAIRHHLFDNWNYLPASVKPYYAIKVAVLGTESTGKTTLSEKLAAHFGCGIVSEAGRDLIDDSNEFCFADLELVATEHAKRIDAAVTGNHPLIIMDTDIYISKSYAQFMFEKKLEVGDAIMESNKAALYLYLNNDVDYFQDGTRLSEADRNLLDLSHRKVLQEHNIPFKEITGNWEERFATAVALVNNLIEQPAQIKI